MRVENAWEWGLPGALKRAIDFFGVLEVVKMKICALQLRKLQCGADTGCSSD